MARLLRRVHPTSVALNGTSGWAWLATFIATAADVPVGQQILFAIAGDAALRFMSGEKAGAKQVFSNLFQRFPESANAHYLYGSLLSPTDPDAAIVQCKQELAVAPTNVTVAAMLARVLLYQAQPAQALPFAQRAASEDPESPLAQLVLGRSLAETGDFSAGIEHLQKALELQPGYLETHIALAGAYASAGRPQDARRERLQSLEMARPIVRSNSLLVLVAALLWFAGPVAPAALAGGQKSFTGCATCHRREAASQPTTLMAQAMQVAGPNPILQAHPRLTFRRGGYPTP